MSQNPNQALEAALKNYYFPAKTWLSHFLDSGRRSPLPVLGSTDSGRPTLALAKAVNAYCHPLPYRMDPVGGALDYYTHSGAIQWQLNAGRWLYPLDCDDLGLMAVDLLHASGVAEEHAWLWNVVINAQDQLQQVDKNHVICGFNFRDSDDWTGVIDTNTAYHNKVAWFKGRSDSQKVQAQVLKHFAKIYKGNYQILVKAPHPFR